MSVKRHQPPEHSLSFGRGFGAGSLRVGQEKRVGLQREEAEVAKEESHDQERALPQDALGVPQKPHRVPLRPKRRVVRIFGEHAYHVKEDLEKEFIMPLKSNRKVAL